MAEHDPVTSSTIEQLLLSWDHEVITVSDGLSAIDALDADPTIQAALLARNMPGCPGIEVINHLRKRVRATYTYTIILSGDDSKAVILDAIEAGADECITKPIHHHELKVRLKAAERIIEVQDQLSTVHEALRAQRYSLEVLNRKLDTKVQTQTAELREAVAIAEKASAMKSLFLANMSHEIRTPLNGIVSYVELLLDSELTPEQQEDLKTIQICVTTLRGLINDVLDFSKIEAGMMHIESAPFDIVETARQTLRIFEASARAAERDLFLEVHPNVPKHVLGDQTRFQQILTNLVSNAIKFTRSDGFVLVQILPGAEPNQLVCAVTDNGIGIEPDKIETIFEAFTQADATTTRRFGGTGLGLTISRKLAHLMSGTIRVQSRARAGSCFILEVPLPAVQARVGSGSHRVKSGAMQAPRPISAKPASLLLAEDDLVNQQAMVRLLRAMGHKVTVADTGVQVLEHLKGAQHFDLVLLDVQMPELNGEDTTKAIRNGQAGPNDIPILILSANVMVAETERYLSCGAQGVIAKPISLEHLFHEIEEHLTHHHAGT